MENNVRLVVANFGTIIPLFAYMDSILPQSLIDDDISYLRELQKAFEPHQSKWRTLQVCIARYTIEQEINHEKNL